MTQRLWVRADRYTSVAAEGGQAIPFPEDAMSAKLCPTNDGGGGATLGGGGGGGA